MTDDEQITPFDGLTEPDQEGDLQPVAAGAKEDDNPEEFAGEELPDQEG